MTVEGILRTTRNAQDVRAGKRDWYRIENRGGEAHVYIYDEVSFFGVTAKEFNADLRGINSSRIVLHLNSPGGNVFDGIAIHNALREHSAEVEARVEGVAASIASVIAMAGDEVVMARGSHLMIHEPFALVIGNAEDMRKMAETVDRFGDTIAQFYADRAGGEVSEWRDRMAAETWYSANEAIDAGLADSLAGEDAAQNTFDLSIFANTPSHLLQSRSETEREPTPREIERALRDAGLSAREAKAYVSAGRQALDGTRDESLDELAAFIKSLNEGVAA